MSETNPTPPEANSDTPPEVSVSGESPPPLEPPSLEPHTMPAPSFEPQPGVGPETSSESNSDSDLDSDPTEPSEARLPASAVHKHFTAPAMFALDRIDEDDATFLVRAPAELEDVSALATDIARLGQLIPIEVRFKAPDRFQVITGFRRVAALKFLQRERVLARLHTDLSDDDAMLLALASAIHAKSVTSEALAEVRDRLQAEGRLPAAARDMLEKALSTGTQLGPENFDEEVDADELAADVTVRLGQCNQDLALLADVYTQLEPARREELLKQLKYSAELVEYLEGMS